MHPSPDATGCQSWIPVRCCWRQRLCRCRLESLQSLRRTTHGGDLILLRPYLCDIRRPTFPTVNGMANAIVAAAGAADTVVVAGAVAAAGSGRALAWASQDGVA